MSFISITQYFNKLQIVLLILLIVPLLVFIALYFFADGMARTSQTEYYYIILPTVVLLDCAISLAIFNKKIKSLRNQPGLGAKLEKYFDITVVRYCLLASASLVLAVGFYLTASDVFTALYVGALALSGFVWPTSRKVTEDLRLKGDEREMVYFKKDSFGA
jgi:hypothetical protein